jgi:hypothetical protein
MQCGTSTGIRGLSRVGLQRMKLGITLGLVFRRLNHANLGG